MRYAALAVCLWSIAACGDDGVTRRADTDAGAPPPQPDGGNAETIDAGIPKDAQVERDAGDAAAGNTGDAAAGDAAASDAGAGDAARELAAALDATGVRTDRRRAELVAGALCQVSSGCLATLLDASAPDVATCQANNLSEWDDAVSAGDSTACLDATLDAAGCVGGASSCLEAVARCTPLNVTRDLICAADAGS